LNLFVSEDVEDPDLIKNTGWPSGILSNSFLNDNQGFIIFRISFNSKAHRPNSPAFLYIYSSSGIEYLKLDCASSGFVYYIDDIMYFDVRSDIFSSENSYYVLFDEGINIGSTFCKAKSTAITSPAFWTFTIPNKFQGTNNKTTASNSSMCISDIGSTSFSTSEGTKCNISALTLLFFLTLTFFVFFHFISLFLLPKFLMRMRMNNIQHLTSVANEKRPYYFKLTIPSSYKFFSTQQKQEPRLIKS
jgi:hypothetical protein